MSNPTLNIQRIYVKNASIESPNAPEIFRIPGNPSDEVKIEKKHSVLASEPNHYEVVLDLTITNGVFKYFISPCDAKGIGFIGMEYLSTDHHAADEFLSSVSATKGTRATEG